MSSLKFSVIFYILMFLLGLVHVLGQTNDYVLPFYTISTFGGFNNTKDGVSIAATSIGQPYDLRSFGSEIFYLERDSVLGNRIRRFSNTTSSALFESNVSTVAGVISPNVFNDAPEGSIASEQLLMNPLSIAFDSRRNTMYIAQDYSYRIRKVDLKSGIISTLVGNLVEQDPGNSAAVSNETSIGLPFCMTYSVADDSLYFFDSSFSVIRKIDLTNSWMTVVAGISGSPGISGDDGLATDAQISSIVTMVADPDTAELYMATSTQIRKINSTGYIIPFAGFGSGSGYGTPYLTYGLSDIQSLLFSERLSSKEILVGMKHQIKVMTFSDKNMYFFAGTEGNTETYPCTDASADMTTIGDLVGLARIQLNGLEYILFAEKECKRIRAFLYTVVTSNVFSVSYTEKYDVAATQFKFSKPTGLSLPSPYSNLYVSDSNSNKIEVIGLGDGIINHLTGTGEDVYFAGGFADAKFAAPAFMNALSDTETLLVSKSKLSVLVFGYSSLVSNIPVNGLDLTYAAEYVNRNEQQFYFVSDNGNIKRYNLTDGSTELYGGSLGDGGYNSDEGAALSVFFNSVSDIKYDSNNDILIVSDSDNHIIRMINLTDTMVTKLAGQKYNGPNPVYSGDGDEAKYAYMNYPKGLLLTPNGDLLIADSGNSVIRRIDMVTKKISTIAGNSTITSFEGENVPATLVNLKSPKYFAMNPQNGEIYFTDSSLTMIKKLTPVCPSGYTLDTNKFKCIPSCFGKDITNACSLHGNCIGANTCQCYSGYYGDECEMFECYSKPKNDSNVCSGYGTCKDFDNCNCYSGFSGSTCETYDCNIPRGNSKCNTGTCNANGTCTCLNGYSGLMCEIFSCFGLSNKDSNVCSGKGTCGQLNVCGCQAGYYGEKCQYKSCYQDLVDNVFIGKYSFKGRLCQKINKYL